MSLTKTYFESLMTNLKKRFKCKFSFWYSHIIHCTGNM